MRQSSQSHGKFLSSCTSHWMVNTETVHSMYYWQGMTEFPIGLIDHNAISKWNISSLKFSSLPSSFSCFFWQTSPSCKPQRTLGKKFQNCSKTSTFLPSWNSCMHLGQKNWKMIKKWWISQLQQFFIHFLNFGPMWSSAEAATVSSKLGWVFQVSCYCSHETRISNPLW